MQANYKPNESEKMGKDIASPLLCAFCSCYLERSTEEKEPQANWKDDVLLSERAVRAIYKAIVWAETHLLSHSLI